MLLDHLLNVTFAQPPTLKPRVMAELNRILAGANLPEFCTIQRNSLASKTEPQKDAIMSQLIDKYPRKHRTHTASTVQVKLTMIKRTYTLYIYHRCYRNQCS